MVEFLEIDCNRSVRELSRWSRKGKLDYIQDTALALGFNSAKGEGGSIFFFFFKGRESIYSGRFGGYNEVR